MDWLNLPRYKQAIERIGKMSPREAMQSPGKKARYRLQREGKCNHRPEMEPKSPF